MPPVLMLSLPAAARFCRFFDAADATPLILR